MGSEVKFGILAMNGNKASRNSLSQARHQRQIQAKALHDHLRLGLSVGMMPFLFGSQDVGGSLANNRLFPLKMFIGSINQNDAEIQLGGWDRH